jgi:hypothetical protein
MCLGVVLGGSRLAQSEALRFGGEGTLEFSPTA